MMATSGSPARTASSVGSCVTMATKRRFCTNRDLVFRYVSRWYDKS